MKSESGAVEKVVGMDEGVVVGGVGWEGWGGLVMVINWLFTPSGELHLHPVRDTQWLTLQQKLLYARELPATTLTPPSPQPTHPNSNPFHLEGMQPLSANVFLGLFLFLLFFPFFNP